eukprot:880033-Rhodomonas_salina.2
MMLHQAQLLAQLGRVGGPDGQPESSAALSEGMGWSNFHIVSFDDSEAAGGESAGSRRRFGRRTGGEDESKDPLFRVGMSVEEYQCARARANPRELRSTALLSFGTVALAYFARVAVVRLIWRWKKGKGYYPPDLVQLS